MSVLLLVGTSVGWSQAPAAQPNTALRFEVTSVKPRPPGTLGGGFDASPTRLSAENMTVAAVIEYAFEVRAPQITGGPAWTRADTFDFDGIAAGGTTPTPADFRTMMRALLAQRFGVKTHRETRQGPAIALGMAAANRLGPDLKPATAPCGTTATGISTCFKRSRAGEVDAVGYDWQRINLASDVMRYGALGNLLVVDRTGLQGRFDLRLRWSPEVTALTVGDSAQLGPDAASMATAIRDQLGLTLRREQMPIEFVVIDQIARPSPD